MKLKKEYVLQTKEDGVISQCEFSNIRDLRAFIHALDYHTYTNRTCDVPSLRIGARFKYTIDGYNIKSEVKWGPQYYIACRASLDNYVLVVETHDDTVLTKPYKATDMVFNPKTMRQVFPPCNASTSEFNKFLNTVKSEKYSIQKIK